MLPFPVQKNYDTAMRALRIAFTSFVGSGYGSGYQAFLAWAKQQLKRGKVRCQPGGFGWCGSCRKSVNRGGSTCCA